MRDHLIWYLENGLFRQFPQSFSNESRLEQSIATPFKKETTCTYGRPDWVKCMVGCDDKTKMECLEAYVLIGS